MMTSSSPGSGGFGLARVEPKLEQPPEALSRLTWLHARIRLVTEDLDGVVAAAPPIAARIALVF